MSTPNYKLRDDHVCTAKHMRDERIRNDSTYPTISSMQNLVSDLADISLTRPVLHFDGKNIDEEIVSKITGILPGEDGNDCVIKSQLDLKADTSQLGSYVKRDGTSTMTGDLNMNSNKVTNITNGVNTGDAVNVSQLNTKKNTGTFDTKIQNAATNSSIDCVGNNQIDIKVNGTVRGQFFQPTGQATTPLGLLSSDKLQLQSQLSSISAYGSKAIDPSPLVLNTHGLYVSGIDQANANVQSTVNVSQGNAQVYLVAGHANPGSGMTDFCALSANKTLQLSGGLQPGIQDKQILLYANSQSQTLPIQVDGKMGYAVAANVTITEATQFPTKAYTDTAVDTKINKSGDTMTGLLTLSGGPTTNLHAATKGYVDTAVSGITVTPPDLTAYTKRDGTAQPTADWNMNGKRITNIINGSSSTDVVTKGYIDGAVSSLQGEVDLKQTITAADTNYLSKTTTDAQTINGDVTIAFNKRMTHGSAPTIGNHVSNKTYCDGKIFKNGDTMTGPLVLSGAPTIDLHASTKKYVDDSNALKVNKSGDTMTGFLNLSALPTNNFHAAPKIYVDNQIATVSGTPTQIATTNGYRLQTDTLRIRANQPTTNLPILDLSYADSRLHYQQQLGTQQRFSIPDSSAVQYEWQYKAAGSTRPEFKIQDRGDLGTQTVRLVALNGNGTGDTYLQIKPNLNAIELSAVASYLGNYDAGLYTSDQQLVPKKYVDDAVILGSIPNKIQNASQSIKVICQTNDVTVENTGGSGDYLVLNQNSIKCDNGTQLTLNRGTASLVIADNGVAASIKPNVPVIYNGITLISDIDQLISRRMGDLRYRRLDQGIDLGNTYFISGVPTPVQNDNAISLGYLNTRLDDNYCQQKTFVITISEVPSGPDGFASDDNCITNVVYTETGAGVAGFYTVSVDSNVFGGANYIVNCGWYSLRSGVSITDSQVAPLVVGNYARTSFTIYFRDTTSTTQNNQIVGTLTRRKW